MPLWRDDAPLAMHDRFIDPGLPPRGYIWFTSGPTGDHNFPSLFLDPPSAAAEYLSNIYFAIVRLRRGLRSFD